MQVEEAIRTRRSVRRFAGRGIPPALLEKVLEAGRWAPSWDNAQPWRLVLVTERERIAALGETEHSRAGAVSQAAAVIAVAGVRGKSGYIRGDLVREQGDWWYFFDLGLAVQNMSLMAHSLGLGSVIVGWLDAPRAAQTLALPIEWELAVLLALGYPLPDAPAREGVRRPLAELCRREMGGLSWEEV